MSRYNKSMLLGRVLAALVAAGLNSAVSAHPQQPYLTDSATQLLYHFDERAGSTTAIDHSGKDNGNGSNRNATYGNGSFAGQAGGDYLSRALKPSLGNTARAFWKDTSGLDSPLITAASGDFTIEGWFQLDSTERLNTYPAVLFGVQPDGSTDSDYMLYIKPVDPNNPSDPNQLGLIFRDRQRFLAYSGTLNWSTGVWYHIAIVATVNGGTTTYRIYRTTAGSAAATVVANHPAQHHLSPTTSTVPRTFSVGNIYGDNGQDYFPGRIDEVRFSSTARTAAEFESMFAPTTKQRIRIEATAPNSGIGHPEQPLPLVGSWNAGNLPYMQQTASVAENYYFTPAWQLGRIQHYDSHLLPWFATPNPELNSSNTAQYSRGIDYYQDALTTAKNWELPISFIGAWNRGDGKCGQWECYLSRHLFTGPGSNSGDPDYIALVGNASPNFLRSNHSPVTYIDQYADTVALLSAFGATQPWAEVGEKWGASQAMDNVQTYYPLPPKVLFVSNNEAVKETWSESAAPKHCGSSGTAACTVGVDQQFLDHNYTLTVAETIKATGEGWVERYTQMLDSWRAELTSAWAGASGFVGYGSPFGPTSYARSTAWNDYGLAYDLGGDDYRLDRNVDIWNGGSAELYAHVLAPGSGAMGDDAVMSVGVEAMDMVFMRDEAYSQNPEFWFELSVWNGCDNIDSQGHPSASACPGFGATYTADRYAGWVRFAMWMLQPRLVRDYRGYSTQGTDPELTPVLDYFNAVAASVDEVYNDEALIRFWRDSQLVAVNSSNAPAYANYKHPYQQAAMTRFANKDRMFMLPVEENDDFNAALAGGSAVPLTTGINVFALARVRGEAGRREWLVYVHAPTGDIEDVHITIPGYNHNNGVIVVDALVKGAFYIVQEDTHYVCPLSSLCAGQ